MSLPLLVHFVSHLTHPEVRFLMFSLLLANLYDGGYLALCDVPLRREERTWLKQLDHLECRVDKADSVQWRHTVRQYWEDFSKKRTHL